MSGWNTSDAHITEKQWKRPATGGTGEIFSRCWYGDRQRAIVQIAHGMAEHSGRYGEFARFLASHGYVVGMNDHAGHGRSAETLGYFADKDGPACVIGDMKALTDELTVRYPGLRVFLLGHSMGSFLARKYATLYGEALSGCILSGTMGRNATLPFGKAVAAVQKKLKGPKSRGTLLTGIAFGSYNKRIQNPINRCAWLSTVDEACVAYSRDALCGFPFTAGGFYDLFSLLGAIGPAKWAAKIPASLPVLIFSGEEDPVGAYGKGPREVYNALISAGHADATLKLYPNGRHEMLHEANKRDVYEDVLTWLNERNPDS
ncbi:MAG: lysophospholipase [Clostridiales Family XIII bacterium]|jgi:alpha-beta hydrolase superfamily lysophospholipase|nr:lysophospholipase [Clostridiales Family XIII bacterium]